jgi:hypothetical protein
MNTGQAIKQKVHQAIDELPSDGLEELVHFLDFLKFKYHTQRPSQAVALGGLWEHVDFDVRDADVRALRRQVTARLVQKM